MCWWCQTQVCIQSGHNLVNPERQEDISDMGKTTRGWLASLCFVCSAVSVRTGTKRNCYLWEYWECLKNPSGQLKTETSVVQARRRRRSRSISFCGKSHLAQLDGNWIMAICLEIRLRNKWWMNCRGQKCCITAVMSMFSRSIAVITVSSWSCPALITSYCISTV